MNNDGKEGRKSIVIGAEYTVSVSQTKHITNHQYDDHGHESIAELYPNVDEDIDTLGQRETWNKKLDFLLSVIGFAVDLSNGVI